MKKFRQNLFICLLSNLIFVGISPADTNINYNINNAQTAPISTESENRWSEIFYLPTGSQGNSVAQTSDDGYIIAGIEYYNPNNNFLLIKTDSLGNQEWIDMYGGYQTDNANCTQQTTDGGYIIIGTSLSQNNYTIDLWLIKTDSNGNMLWDKSFGTYLHKDKGHWVEQTTDGGYILAGSTASFGVGSYDAWIIKTDSFGNEIWSQTFGTPDWDGAARVHQTTDGCYIVIGGMSGDIWLLKLDSIGNEIWSNTYGSGTGRSVDQTTDGGYILTGDTENNVLLLKTDSIGNEICRKTFGGDGTDKGYAVEQTQDDGFIICGYTFSYGPGKSDVWLIKTDSIGDTLWTRTYGGPADDQFGGWGRDVGYDMQQTDDGGYIITGYTRTDDIGNWHTWLIKTDENGETEYLISQLQADVTSAEVPFTVNFTDLTSHGIGELTSWYWDFGDGCNSTEQNPTHEYQVGGIYNVSLTVTDENGLVNTRTKADYINAIYYEPMADFTADTTYGQSPFTVNFTDLSTPGTGAIVSWDWDFGDTTYSNEQNPTHIYQNGGVFIVSLTVTDEYDSTDTHTKYNYIIVDGTHINEGNVSGTWTLEGTPYLINGEITILQDDELLIEPGVDILFQGHYKFNVYGRLEAQGTIDDSITFTAQDTLTGWDALRFFDTNTNGQDSSKIVYCKLKYGITPESSWVSRSGGIICDNSSDILIMNSLIQKNSASTSGGGINLYSNSNIIIKNNIIINNKSGLQSWFGGGGIYCHNSSPPIINNKIMYNKGWFGGGIYCGDNSNAEIKNNEILYNFAMESGGGITVSSSTPDITNNIICNNKYYWSGGGIGLIAASPIISNCTIANNFYEDIYDHYGGGIHCCFGSNPTLVNCILWNNSQDEVFFYDWGDPNSITISYTDIEGGYYSIVTNGNGTINWLSGNIDSNPLFADLSNEDYHLTEGSPCIDAGNPSPQYYDPEDPNNPGYALYPAMGTIINDMGAYGGPFASDWIWTSVDDDVIPYSENKIRLYQNYPNPFRASTTISFSAIPIYRDHPTGGDSRNLSANLQRLALIRIYNIKGQLVKTLIPMTNDQSASWRMTKVVWDGKDNNGKKLSDGIYFYKLDIKNSPIKKMLLLR